MLFPSHDPKGTKGYYDIGPNYLYRQWKIGPEGIVIYRHDEGRRIHILPGSLRHVEVNINIQPGESVYGTR